jgi:hypothetical protein
LLPDLGAAPTLQQFLELVSTMTMMSDVAMVVVNVCHCQKGRVGSEIVEQIAERTGATRTHIVATIA